MDSIAHEYLGLLVTPPRPGTFKLAYTKNIVNKVVLHHIEEIINGKRKDVTYTKHFEIDWVDYTQLAEIVTGQGWSIARPFEGEKRDETITMISYIGLDFDGITQEEFETIKEQPFVKGRGFFNYSASHGIKEGVSAHWVCPLEKMAEISTEEHRNTWRMILIELVDSIKLGDRKVKDLQRLFYGAKGQAHEVWGDGVITIAELEAIHAVAFEKNRAQEAKRIAALANSTKRRRSKDHFSFKDARKMTAEFLAPHLDERGEFPDIEWGDDEPVLESYNAWLGYFLGWKEEIGLEAAAKLMDEFSPERTMGSYKKLASFKNEGGHLIDPTRPNARVRRFTFGTTMKILRHFGYGPEKEAFGQALITSDYKFERRYMNMEDIKSEQKCVMVKSPKGTGKTELISKIAASGLRVLIIGHRRALLRNTTGRTRIPNYQDVVPSEATSLCITVDSLHKLDLKRQEFDIVIIDEVEQVLQHCIGETLQESRAAALSLFRILLKDASQVYCFDADLSNVSINFMKKHIGAKKVFVVENTFKLSNRTIEMYPSKFDIIRATEKALADGLKVALATNSKREADKAEEQMRNLYPQARILSITQENSDNKDIQDLIQHIDDRVKDIDLLIYSPSLGTGVSIDTEHFDYVHVIGVKDVTTHFDLDQQANRVRNIKQHTVRAWIGQLYDDDVRKETDPAVLKQICILNAHETGIEVIMNEDRSLAVAHHDAWYIELWSDIMSLRNSSMNHLEKCFVKLMEEQGHKVVQMRTNKTDHKASRDRNVAAGKAVEKRRVEAIVEAELLDSIGYEALTRQDALNYQQKRMVEKYDIHEFYQQLITPELVIKDNQGRFRNQVILLEMVCGYHDAAHFDVMEASVRNGQYEQESRVMVPHRKFYGPKKKLVNELLEQAGLGSLDGRKLEEFGNRDIWYSNRTLQTGGFVDWLSLPETGERLERHLGIKLRSNFADQPALVLGMTLRKLGFDVKEQKTKKKGLADYKSVSAHEYQVSKFSVDEMLTIVNARAEKYHQDIVDTALMHTIMVEYELKGKTETAVVRPEAFVSFAGVETDAGGGINVNHNGSVRNP